MKQRIKSRLKQRRKLFLREWRNHRVLTQEQLAERAGISQGMISQLEKGTTDFSGETLAALADALQCEPADLIMRNPGDPEAPWTIWDTLEKPQKRQAIEIMKALKRTGSE